YARGVNAAIAQMGGALPLELRLLKIKPEPWTATDSLSWGKVMALNLCANFEGELFRQRLIEKIGAEKAVHFELRYAPGAPLIVPPTAVAADTASELARLYAATKEFLPLGAVGASNNWVVSGARTESGKP